MSVDARFYLQKASLSVGEIVEHLGLNASGGVETLITGVSSLAAAGPNDLCFIERKEHLNDAKSSKFGLCLTLHELHAQIGRPHSVLILASPRTAFFKIARQMFSLRQISDSEQTSAVHPTTKIGPGAVLADGVAIGPGSRIGSGVVIGPGVQIGSECEIGAHVSITASLIGNGVRIQSGARLGESGFGLMPGVTGAQDIPHFGRVIIQDNVSIGANTCVDRGLLDDTIIGEGTKVDNMSHIGHNTVIGRHVVMAAYAGISGSVVIGDGVRMGGRVGIIDHAVIGAGAQLAIGSLIMGDVPSGEVWAGNPARPMKTWQRETIWLKKNAKRKPPN